MASAASRSMFGDVSGNLQPKTPSESALMSSTVMIKMLGRSADRAEAFSINVTSNTSAYFMGFFPRRELTAFFLDGAIDVRLVGGRYAFRHVECHGACLFVKLAAKL